MVSTKPGQGRVFKLKIYDKSLSLDKNRKIMIIGLSSGFILTGVIAILTFYGPLGTPAWNAWFHTYGPTIAALPFALLLANHLADYIIKRRRKQKTN